MYKLWKRVISLTLSLALLVPLAACGGGLSPDDATTYIQGILDENYKGIYDAEFLEMIDSTETEAQEIYQNSIEVEADFLIGSLMDNAPTEEQRSELIELYKEIYAKASYTVDTATEIDESTYGVKVTVAPIDIFHQLMDEVSSGTTFTEFNAQYPDTMDDDQYYEYEIAWFQLVLDTLRELIPSLGYLEEQSRVVQVTLGDDNYWSLNEEDFNTLDRLIIDYNF